MGKAKAPPAESPLASLDNFEARLAKALDRAEKDPESFEGAHEREGNPRPLAPRVPEVEDIVAKHSTRTAAAGQAWKDGVLRPKKDPIQAAIAAKGKWATKLQAAIQDDSFAKGLAAVDEEEMVRIIEATDPSVFTGGVARREGKYRAKMEKTRPMVLALAEEIDKMPQDTEAQREARMLAATRGMREIGKRLKA